MRYVIVFFWTFLVEPGNDPRMNPKKTKLQKIPNFKKIHAIFCQIFENLCSLELLPRSTTYHFDAQ